MGLKEIVEQFAREYEKNRDKLPNADLLETDLCEMSGLEKTDSYFVYIPIDSKDLQYFGSACGRVGNRIFSNKSLISFLRNRGVKYILGIIYKSNFERDGEIPLSSIALPIVGKEGHIFEYLASKYEGSFRYERSAVEGWSVYESE